MEATLVIEHRFRRDQNGKIFSSSNSVDIQLWDRYLQVFERLTVLARIQNVHEPISDNYLVEHNRVKFVAIPYYVGAKEFLLQYLQIKKTIQAQVKPNHAYICRVPSILGTLLIRKLSKAKAPYVVEVVGDPWEVFAPGSLLSPLSFIHRYRSYSSLKKNVKLADGVIYVTEKTLQKRYPASNNALTTYASNVILKENDIAVEPKCFPDKIIKLKILSIGSLEQLYKSPDLVLNALSILKKEGLVFEFTWLGEGKFRSEMVSLATELGLENEVAFKGNVSKKEVFKNLVDSDLYVHVSRTEGLPRALIEAMAQGLPCIGTDVGGIPELLDRECIIDKNNIDSLVNKILFLKNHPSYMSRMSKANLEKAKEYEFNLLEKRRNTVYWHLKKLVE